MVSTEDDAWIALLNDISLNRSYPISSNIENKVATTKVLRKDVTPVSFDDEIFFNDDGEPTDRFLEAVNADLKKRSTFCQKSDIAGSATIDEGLDSLNEYAENAPFSLMKVGGAGKHKGKVNFARCSLPSDPTQKRYTHVGARSETLPASSTNRNATLSSSIESSGLNDDLDVNEIENHSTGNLVKEKKIQNSDDNDDNSVDVFASSSELVTNIPKNYLKSQKCGRTDISGSIVKNTVNKSQKVTKMKKNQSTADSVSLLGACGKMKKKVFLSESNVTPSYFHDSMLIKVVNDSGHRSLHDHEMIESESKLKSFKLRLQGQLATIRSLELQLQQSNDLVKIRSSQIIQLQSKLKSLNDSYQQSSQLQQQSPLHNGNSGDFDAKFEEVINQYKVN
jgi:hypothetical protein